MKTLKALGGALAITVISCILLTFTHGLPTSEQLVTAGAEMFAVAFIVLRVFVVKS